ncbi:MAG: hypothetical protein ACHQ01_02400 [Candidatus Limnocylindrales bacterium]
MNNGWREIKNDSDRNGRAGTLGIGLLLVVIGLFFFVSEQVNFDLGRYGWPIFVIVPGLFLLILGLAIPHEGGLGAAIPGGLVLTVGLLLAFQDATDTYASWSYAWALVAPGSVGATLTLYGLLHRRWDLLDAGLRTAAVGLCLFVGFGLFFENIIGIDDAHPNTVLRDALPVMAVSLGALIVLWNLIPRHGSRRPALDTWSQGEAPVPPATPPAVPPAG